MNRINLMVLLLLMTAPSFAFEDVSQLTLKETVQWLNEHAVGRVTTYDDVQVNGAIRKETFVEDTGFYGCKILKEDVHQDPPSSFSELDVGLEGVSVPIYKLIMYKGAGRSYHPQNFDPVLTVLLKPSKSDSYAVGLYDNNPIANPQEKADGAFHRLDFSTVKGSVAMHGQIEAVLVHWITLCAKRPPEKILNVVDDEPVKDVSKFYLYN